MRGTQRVFLSVKSPYFDSEGRVAGVIGIARDITERKRAEADLKRLNETLEDLVAERTRPRAGFYPTHRCRRRAHGPIDPGSSCL